MSEQKELKRLVRFEGVPVEQRGEVWRMLIRCRVWGTRAGLGDDYYRVLEQHLNDPKVRLRHGQPAVIRVLDVVMVLVLCADCVSGGRGSISTGRSKRCTTARTCGSSCSTSCAPCRPTFTSTRQTPSVYALLLVVY